MWCKHKAVVWGCFIALFYITGCDKKEELDVNYHYDYFPLQVGHYVAYQVDSVTYNYDLVNYKRDTATFQVKELVADTFYDNLNQLNYRVELYRRADSTQPWVIWKVWSALSTITNAQKNEDEIRFVKLVFPPAENKEWNGNLYVPKTEPYKLFENWEYTYTQVHKPYTAGSLSFDSTVTVEAVDFETVIEKRLRKEVYAKNVGMVFQQWEALKKQNVSKDWITGPETGFRITMRAIEHN